MLKIEKDSQTSLTKNINFEISESSLQKICEEVLDKFPVLNMTYEKADKDIFRDTYGLKVEEEVFVDNYLENVLSRLCYDVNGKLSITSPYDLSQVDVPLVVAYNLAKKYGLIDMKRLLTKIPNGSKFIPKWLFNGNNTKIKVSDLNGFYNVCELWYNTNTSTVFNTSFIGDLDSAPNDSTEIKKFTISVGEERTETKAFNGTLKIPSTFVSKNATYTESPKVYWSNVIKYTRNDAWLPEMNNVGNVTTTDGSQFNIPVPTNLVNDGAITLNYKMFKENTVSDFVNNYLKNNALTVISSTYPYDKWIYRKPGDSKVVKTGLKTIDETVNSDVFLADGEAINVGLVNEYNHWYNCSHSGQDGHTGRRFKGAYITGWQPVNGYSLSNVSDLDVTTLSQNDYSVNYSFKKSLRYRKGTILKQKVYETDKDCYVKEWNGESKIIYLQNDYSYGTLRPLAENPRTACLVTASEDIYILTEKSKEAIKKLGRIGLYYYLNECINIFNEWHREASFVYHYKKYISEASMKLPDGTYEDNALLGCILVKTYEQKILQTSELETLGKPFIITKTQTKIADADLLYELHLPKLTKNGNNIHFSTSLTGNFNKYYVYGNSSIYKVKKIPFETPEGKIIDNIFLVHHEVFNASLNKGYPTIFQNYDIYGS